MKLSKKKTGTDDLKAYDLTASVEGLSDTLVGISDDLTNSDLMKKRDTGEGISPLAASVNPLKDLFSEEENSPVRKKRKVLPILLGITILLAVLIFGGIYFRQKSYYANRWYENTKINDVDVSGQTLEESKKMILDKMGNYALTVKGRNNGSMTINGEDVDFYFSLTSEFDQIFSKQHKKFSLFSNSYDFSAKYDISYDQSKLKKILKQSDFIKGTSAYPIEKPKSATVKFSEETGKFECIKENPGNKLIFNKFLSAVEETIENGNVNLDLTDTEKYPDMYRNPKVSSDSPELKKKQNTYNYNALRYVVWNMGKGVTEQITPVELTEWSTYENGTLTFDEEKISDWVENFCKKYKTTDKTRLVKMHDNKIVTVQPGDYGWQIDYESALRQAKSVINKKIKRSVINAYLKEPSEENKKAVTFRKKVPYSNTAFQMDTGEDVNYEDVAYDYDTENFTEVSLKEQMVYVIRDGKVAFSCRCISGRPTPERSTKPGAYFIKEHQLNRILRGDNYVTPVTNWVRITWSGTGFHSAKWQRWGSWTPTYYQTRGSHGCVNLSIEDSKTIYDMVKYREAVFIY